MIERLRCLVSRHQWHNGWDDMEHVTVWTCKRCGTIREEQVQKGDGTEGFSLWSGGGGGSGGGGF